MAVFIPILVADLRIPKTVGKTKGARSTAPVPISNAPGLIKKDGNFMILYLLSKLDDNFCD
jgi:hypothetical protein